MRVAGEERVITALLSCNCKLRVRGYISALPTLIRELAIDKAYKIYVTDTLRNISENTAQSAAYCSGGKMGNYIETHFSSIYDTKPEETRTPDEIISHIRQKLKEVRE